MRDKPKVRYGKVEINGKLTRRKVHCVCTTGHGRYEYADDDGKDDKTKYFYGLEFDEPCPVCGFYFFYYIEGSAKHNEKYLRKGK